MINVADVNRRLAEQDAELRADLTDTSTRVADPDLRVVAEILASGIAALHERQGNLITLMLQANR